MKAFIAGTAIAIVVALGTALIFEWYGISAEDAFSTENVRLHD